MTVNINHVGILLCSGFTDFTVVSLLISVILVFAATNIKMKFFKSMSYMGVVFGTGTTDFSIEDLAR